MIIFPKASEITEKKYSDYETRFLGIIEKLLDGFVQTEYELAGNIFTTFITGIHLYQGIYEIMDKTVQAAGATLEALNDDFNPRR